ncbi:hypothetical protein GALMADRAFT_259916, partial [Galerina marginata CBS 339.88]
TFFSLFSLGAIWLGVMVLCLCFVTITPRILVSWARRILLAIARLIRIQADTILPYYYIRFARPFRLIFRHIILHLVGLSFGVLGLATCFVLTLDLFEYLERLRLTTPEWLAISMSLIFEGVMIMVDLGAIIFTLRLMYSFVLPFISYRRSYSVKFYYSLFDGSFLSFLKSQII